MNNRMRRLEMMLDRLLRMVGFGVLFIDVRPPPALGTVVGSLLLAY
jgi:hypothetical protein